MEPASQPSGVGRADRILTIPNAISFARLIGVPVFLYLFLATDATVAAVVVLAVGGSSDWVDGYLARRLNQVSRLGELMDPLADRLYILATLIAFTVRSVVTWQFTAALLLRDAMMIVCLLVMRRHNYGPPAVHYIGKTATFILLFAFPVLLLAHALDGRPVDVLLRVRLGTGVVGDRPLLDRRRVLCLPGRQCHPRAVRLIDRRGRGMNRRAWIERGDALLRRLGFRAPDGAAPPSHGTGSAEPSRGTGAARPSAGTGPAYQSPGSGGARRRAPSHWARRRRRSCRLTS